MEIKAFNKICSEAEEAFAERRFFDALSLTEAIVKDLPALGDNPLTDEVKKLHDNYCAVLRFMLTPDGHKALLSKSEALFQQAFQLLQTARHRWACAHPEASTYAKTAGLFATITDDDIVLHLQNLNGLNEGEPVYYQQLDAAFNFLWCHQPDSLVYGMTLRRTLLSADCFVRRTLIGALLLSLLECFLPNKVELLIALGTPQEGDSEYESNDLQARVAVALAVICQRYSSVLELFPQDTQLIRAFFQRDYVQSHMETLLHAFTCQSLVDSVEHRVDDIMHIIRDTFEKVQPHLTDNENDNDNGRSAQSDASNLKNGNDNDNVNGNDNGRSEQSDASNLKTDNDSEKGDFHIDIKQINIDAFKDGHLLDQLAEHAKKVDRMRQSDLDINKPSFSFLKGFPFFRTPAHWFYPFSRLVPDIKPGITLSNGNTDLMTLAIMNANRFCDSDCYSYASMTTTYNVNSVLNFNKSFGKDKKHTVIALLGTEVNINDLNTLRAEAQSGMSDHLKVIQGYTKENTFAYSDIVTSRMFSVFGLLSYGFAGNRYKIEGVYRRDGSSRFGANTRWANFPSYFG